jgi:hypothetical protein
VVVLVRLGGLVHDRRLDGEHRPSYRCRIEHRRAGDLDRIDDADKLSAPGIRRAYLTTAGTPKTVVTAMTAIEHSARPSSLAPRGVCPRW